MRFAKIYTRSGDKGTTSLIGGDIIKKSDLRLECYGTIDELNAFIGMLKVLCSEEKIFQKQEDELNEVQSLLSDIGAILATPEGKEWLNMPSINQTHIDNLEESIDFMKTDLQPIEKFVVPGDSIIDAQTHICRTVCRRAERILSKAKDNNITISGIIMAYINRLSDYFFILGRYALHLQGK